MQKYRTSLLLTMLCSLAGSSMASPPKEGILDTKSPEANSTTLPANAKLGLHIFVSELDPQTGNVLGGPSQVKTMYLLEPDQDKKYQTRKIETTTSGLIEGTLYLGLKETGALQSRDGLMTLCPIIDRLGNAALQGSFVDRRTKDQQQITFTTAIHGTGVDMTLPNGRRSYQIIIEISPKPVIPAARTAAGTTAGTTAQTQNPPKILGVNPKKTAKKVKSKSNNNFQNGK